MPVIPPSTVWPQNIQIEVAIFGTLPKVLEGYLTVPELFFLAKSKNSGGFIFFCLGRIRVFPEVWSKK